LNTLVSYQIGDLLALPFPDSCFDAVWTQHVVMNIPDRERVYREFRRVLRPGGKLAFYDVLATDAKLELHFPVPWPENSETSFLFTQDETSSVLATAGFAITTWKESPLKRPTGSACKGHLLKDSVSVDHDLSFLS
jgi:ubiquinone/menaquinone biosynthesis C-methylase UbiE